MKLQAATLSWFITFHLLGTSDPRYSNDFSPACNRPEEEPNVFHSCNASSCHRFPSMSAICKCAKCDWAVQLKCHSNGAWYPSVADVCTTKHNCHKKCNTDEFGTFESPVQCSIAFPEGLKEIYECRCKTNCVKTEVRCDENEGWVFNNTTCQALVIDRMREEGNLTFSFRNSIVTYECDPGFDLQGNLTNRCKNGYFDGPPECVPVKLDKIAVRMVDNNDIIPIPVSAFCIILTLLTLAFIGCGAWIWRLYKSRSSTVTSEVPTQPIDIGAANPTEPECLELMVVNVASTSKQTPAMSPLDTPSGQEPSIPAISTSQAGEPIYDEANSGKVSIPVRPGDPNSPYADVLNLDNHQEVAEYEYIRINGRKV